MSSTSPRKAALSAWLSHAKWSTRSAVRSRQWWWSTCLLIAFWVAFGVPLYQISAGYGVAHTIFGLLLAAWRAWRYSGPNEMKLVERDYIQRKLHLYALIKRVIFTAGPTERELASFENETLVLIAMYVRAHRADHSGRAIFVNLLVPVGHQSERLRVIRRNHEMRPLGVEYATSAMLAGQVFPDRTAQYSPDLIGDGFDPHGGTYRSVLAIPVHAEDGEVLGVVSIDSTEKFQFEYKRAELIDALRPYAGLLAWSLHKRRLGGTHEHAQP